MKGIHFLSMLPFIGMLGFLPLVNQVEPYVLGMPFIMFWVVLWAMLTSVTMAIVFRFDPANKEDTE
ncbi:DUF3311 domain-containing protein [Priestia endophytica]|jgi:Protein of unknown function (DUF3311)|uniref:Uncharacterized protein n=1 Tax=Priestia endophytica TaxID=135735 RepID=A0A3N6B235_9BACI|nr:DUF3311 domain-containing protein [Priestia endophytica]MCM3538127.1 DUF3311 domain-containing protein [Priestia endophytica]MED4071969.1 DUF3311 domain-containing protein [Priestia endophytica]RAS76061.1 hypothetical protein A3864_14365 [Priestia endophytica]RAS81028.1 hypothetical protein A4U60_13680 [Priestia endophytica]RAS85258.1 hypothetical protein A3863_20200 [Priestia endophytica]